MELLTLVWLFLHIPLSHAQPKNSNPIDLYGKQIKCEASQRGFHVEVRCQFFGFENSVWDGCVLKLRLSQGFYVDPYELSSLQPDTNFTLSKAALHGNQSFVFGRWLSWLSRGDDVTEEVIPTTAEVPMNRSEVNVEAPTWMAEAMTVNVHLQNRDKNGAKSEPLRLQIPVHVRYRSPRDDGVYIDHTQLAHPSVKCEDGFEYNKWNTIPPFKLSIPVPPTSDLLYVMPVTVLLLTVGLFVLLIA